MQTEHLQLAGPDSRILYKTSCLTVLRGLLSLFAMFKSRRPPEYQTVVVKVDMRSDRCVKRVAKCLQAMGSVNDYDVNLASKKVTVSGRVNPIKLIKRLKKKSGLHSEIWTEIGLASRSLRRSSRFDDSFRYSDIRLTDMFNDDNTSSCSVM
ncbi:hypothetical protein KP509_01G076000 [Ceratopteris richardii]|uniref:HMA domain-containing protein n=1 Tax=Ceratopteris richardii TaxID=49495 RepID=A0A8T2VI79_CERRI|nr:hypothetical protein KP509_01G076000 [Ceratopteris richardii]